MTHKLINTGSYLLVVSDEEIKEGDKVYWKDPEDGLTSQINTAIEVYVDLIFMSEINASEIEAPPHEVCKIIAHLPLNNLPILQGVDLLPPLEQEDDVEKLADIEYEESRGNGTEYAAGAYSGFISGYNKTKEKYKFTEEDMRKAIELAKESRKSIIVPEQGSGSVQQTSLSANRIIQSLSQPKLPVAFKCELNLLGMQVSESEKIKVSWMPIPGVDYTPKIKTTTNSQGQNVWVGEYIY